MNGYTLTDKMRKARRHFRFTATEQALFYELVAICNGEDWRDVFDCSNIELCYALNINERTLMKARETLINAGVIYYKSGKSKRTVSSYSFTRPFKSGLTTVNNTTVPPTDAPTLKTTHKTIYSPTDKAAKEPDYNKPSINKTKNNIPIHKNDSSEELNFDVFWELYDKKVGKKENLKKKWDKLSSADKQAIIRYIPPYKTSQPHKQYRKNPETFLNNRSWEDELIFDNTQLKTNGKPEKNSHIQSAPEAQKDYTGEF